MIYVKTNNKSTQNWLIVESIDKNGIIKIKNKNIFIKLIRVQPINFNLKTTLEKEAILNSYKILLKTCNFNLQILIHTNKEDISKIVSNVKKSNNDSISIISKKYIEFLNKINSEKQTSTKNYYIIIDEQSEIENENLANIYYMLNEKYFKIKECLNKCGNLQTHYQYYKLVLLKFYIYFVFHKILKYSCLCLYLLFLLKLSLHSLLNNLQSLNLHNTYYLFLNI